VYVELSGGTGNSKALLLCLIYFGAATSKESAAVFPFAMALIHTFMWTFERDSSRWIDYMWRNRAPYCAILVAGSAYIALRLYVMSQHPSAGSALLTSAGGWSQRALMAGFSLAEYAKLVFVPWITTAPVHPYDFTSLAASTLVFVPACVALLLSVLCFSAVKLRARWPYPVLIFVVMVSPVLHLINFSAASSLVADRYALAPLALGIIVAVPLCATQLARIEISRVFAVTLGALGLLVVFSWIAIARVTTVMWRDDVSLWAYAYSRAPQSEMAASNYVSSLLKIGKIDEAEIIAKKIRDSGRTSMSPLTNFALIKGVRGDFEAAYGLLQAVDVKKTKGLTSDDLANYYCAFAQIDKLKGNWPNALQHSEAALQHDPQLITCQMVKARALFNVGSKLEAIVLLTSIRSTVSPKMQNEIDQLLKDWKAPN
jgi:protein O-mannosyl-transferase